MSQAFEVLSIPIEAEQTEESHICVECNQTGKKQKAFYWCQDCLNYYCKEHDKIIHSFSVFSKHQRTEIDKIATSLNSKNPLKCEKHNEKLEIYCFDDEKIICYKCAISKHNGHALKPISEFNDNWNILDPNYKEEIKQQGHFNTTVKERKHLLEMVEKEKKKIEKKSVNLKKQVQKKYIILQELIENKINEIKNSIDQEKNDKIKKLNKQYNIESGNISDLENFPKIVKYLNLAKKNNNYFEIIQKELIIKKLCSLTKTQPELVCTVGKKQIFTVENQIQSINNLQITSVISIQNSLIKIGPNLLKPLFTNIVVELRGESNNYIPEIDIYKSELYVIKWDGEEYDENKRIYLNDLNWKRIEQAENNQNIKISCFQSQFQIDDAGKYLLNMTINDVTFPRKQIEFSPTSASKILPFEVLSKLFQLIPNGFDLKLNYQLGRDAKDMKVWRQKCYDKGQSLVILKGDANHIFGGYSEYGWKDYGGQYQRSDNSFLFYFDVNNQLKILNLIENKKKYAICWNRQRGPLFGEGATLRVEDSFRAEFKDRYSTYQSPPRGSLDFLGVATGLFTNILSFECFCEKL
ncbi:hypothetical protein M0812_04030 [Anaeramoeba flamelloides]|uniref:B box-type domain-containing protein n=1 Tax=Anaeramoeba flamelloides TaxID=1746091 RepID=A0AAV8ADA9_9EUKA|nr:hypothetical protein M0812_04030 [Anaeramoeba flamelloides]